MTRSRLSQRGCQIIAEQSGHGVALGQPEVVVRAIRAIVDAVNGRNDASLCGQRSGDSEPSND